MVMHFGRPFNREWFERASVYVSPGISGPPAVVSFFITPSTTSNFMKTWVYEIVSPNYPLPLESIKGETAKTIKILDFVDLHEIDPIYYQKAYYLSPDMAGAGAYSLLLEAIKQTGKIGIAKISIRSKSSLAAIRVVGNCLCMETMNFPDEIRTLANVPNLPPVPVVNEKELNMAKTLVEQLSEKFLNLRSIPMIIVLHCLS
jgi:hypothetical protein